jgi:hypothetical protein
MFISQVWVHGEMDPTGEFITTNEFWDVEGLHTKFTKNSMFQTLKTQVGVLFVKGEAIWRVQPQ